MEKKAKTDSSHSNSAKRQRAAKSVPVSVSWYRNNMQLWLLISVIIITAMCFSPILSSTKEFINFDDPVYITKQDLITKVDMNHLKAMFSAPDASLNYHPITMFSLAVNYNFSQLHPFGYFFTNLGLHLLNTFLVFIFLFRLSGRKFWVGLIAAALFGFHPMHVESVAWASERKDLLYCFFFLLSCIAYLSYIETKQRSHLVFCFVFFVLSCLSKAMAVPLPLVLLLIDYYRKRKFTLKTLVEKIPFFLLALIIGYAAVKIQSKGAIADFNQFSLLQRFMFASYGLMMYFEKLLLPFRLSAFYPYPTLNEGDVPMIYKFAPFIALALIAIPLVIAFKRNKETFRTWAFGTGFFILMIALVLQFISVGAAIMADRYSYVSYIGLFFIVASIFNGFMEKKETKTIASVLLTVVVVLLAVTCYARVEIWQNDEILWTDVIEKYPYITENNGGAMKVLQEGVSIAYSNRANYYRTHNEMDKAFTDYEILTRYHTKDEGAYNNMGNLYCMKAENAASKGDMQTSNELYAKAINMYSEAIKLNPKYIDAIHNRGITYSGLGDHRKALDDLNAVLQLNRNDNSLLAIVGNEEVQLGMYKEAVEDFNHALSSTPDDAMLLFYRGTAYINAGKYNQGIADLGRAVAINPALGNAWFNLSVGYNKINNNISALDAASNAKKNGYMVSDQYLYGLQSGSRN